MGTIQPVHVGHVLIQMLALATLVEDLFILYHLVPVWLGRTVLRPARREVYEYMDQCGIDIPVWARWWLLHSSDQWHTCIRSVTRRPNLGMPRRAAAQLTRSLSW